MIRVQASSRLHFGVFSLPPGHAAPQGGLRYFGGVGLMVERPAVTVSVRPAHLWSATGPAGQRALDFARRMNESLGSAQPLAIEVEESGPAHVGLGAGTQLGLATARAVALANGQGQLDAVELARRIGRGRRSALGVHGFAAGGFLVEGGKAHAGAVSPLIVRMDFPANWRVLLVVPQESTGLSGRHEEEAFARLAGLPSDSRRTEKLCRVVLLSMLPALVERDLEAFGEAVFEFNQGVGEMFAPEQGGIYAVPRTAQLIEALRRHKVHGVGQSSWGPTVFAVVDASQGPELRRWLVDRRLALPQEIVLTQAANQGARVETMPASPG